MKKVYGYIRVSTVKQGEGVSLIEQKNSIQNYADIHQLKIVEWFEEKETAAKKGRPFFSRMLTLLKRKKADGVIIHKIDRSARNLKDWADLGDLIDMGCDVHFSFEAIDFNTRGGRLSADIQAVISADYIRNLREETKKGLYGRLKQGIYPFDAPIGYLNTGGGVPKAVDKIKAPLVRKLFNLYATGQYGIVELGSVMFNLGLTNRNSKQITRNGIAHILSNSFYIGIIKLRKNGQVFEGIHDPILSKKLFDDVQKVLKGKAPNLKVRHDYLFRRRIRCKLCNKSLIGEKQRSHIYYRCHDRECPTKTIREDVVEEVVIDFLSKISVNKNQINEARKFFGSVNKKQELQKLDQTKAINLELTKIETRTNSLIEKLLDGLIEDSLYTKLKEELLHQKVSLTDKLREISKESRNGEDNLKFLEHLKKLKSIYLLEHSVDQNELKRELLNILTSNIYYSDQKLSIQTKPIQR
jgi:DNA invertase Pin-like site-specific DNA recombinase